MKAAIIAIGTEVTSGEINNTNSRWLAQKLEEKNIEVLMHITVPDEKTLMFEAFSWAEKNCDMIFTTGGLGPTTDDFTREIIAEYYKTKLVFDRSEHQRLKELFATRDRQIKEAHKQQCYFPENSKQLDNLKGTAKGFMISGGNSTLYALPGPPKEVESVWDNGVLKDLPEVAETTRLYKWEFNGISESEIAEKVEALFSGTSVKLGYRANKPRVIVKAWVPVEDVDSLGEKLGTMEGLFPGHKA